MEGTDVQLHSLFTSALKEVSGELHDSAALSPGKNAGTHSTGGWGSPRAGLDVSEETKISFTCLASNPGASNP
jgi:hypothetical protein